MQKLTVFHTNWGYFGIIGTNGRIMRTILPVENHDYYIDLLRNYASDSSGDKAEISQSEILQDDKYFKETADLITAYYNGDSVDFSKVKVDLAGKTDFAKDVLSALRSVSFGQTITYSQLAELAGYKGAARAVGTVLANNPIPLIIPCHRVILANGQTGNFSAEGGIEIKKRMLAIESK